jgi:hypothetical protein
MRTAEAHRPERLAIVGAMIEAFTRPFAGEQARARLHLVE